MRTFKVERVLLTGSRTSGAQWRTALGAMLMGGLVLGIAPVASGQILSNVTGTIESLVSNDPTHTDRYAGGVMMVGRNRVIIPRNMVITIPANWLTLTELFQQAPAACVTAGETGLASADTCLNGGVGGVATILGNRQPNGDVIAGEFLLEKGQESLVGQISFISYTDGYFRVNGDGTDTDATGGTMIRINDPDSRHTIQQGAGCAGGPNCSADPRYTNDPDNYTFNFSTGYPACIPSTSIAGLRESGSDANGIGDPFCPDFNLNRTPAQDSRFFAPIQIGDSVTADGNYETIGGVTFLSAHTILVMDAVTTADDPNQPDYMIFDEVEWDTAGFQNDRVRMLLIGFTSLGNANVDVFTLQVDPATNENHEVILASTAGCEAFAPGTCLQQGTPPTTSGIFKIRYDVDFIEAAINLAIGDPVVKPRFSPCFHLANMNHPDPNVVSPCGAEPFTLDDEFSVLVPITRELIGRTRHSLALNPGINSFDINGQVAQNGAYLTPVGIGHPEFVEINLAALGTAQIFEGQPWNLDARLGPVGCDGDCFALGLTAPLPLDPFPFSGLDPRTQAQVPPDSADKILSFFSAADGGASTRFFDLTVAGSTFAGTSLSLVPTAPPATAPIADAGVDAIVAVGEVVQLNGAASIGTIDTFSWVQLTGDPVVLQILQPDSTLAGDGTATVNPAFIFPATPQTLTFELTVTGPGGSAVANVSVTADNPLEVDVLGVTKNRYIQNKDKWRIQGSSSIVGPGHAVTAYLGTPTTGIVIGTSAVDALGLWDIRTPRDSGPDPTNGGPNTVTLVSSLGGTLVGLTVTVN